MPTYTYRCPECAKERDVIQTMGEYVRAPSRPTCCTLMVRSLSVVPNMSGLANALAGDRHYDGLRASDGTNIGSRTRHRQYMQEHKLALADDFKGEWSAAAKDRLAQRTGKRAPIDLRRDVEDTVRRALAK